MSCFCIIEAYTAGGRVRPKMTVGAAYGPCLSLAAGSGKWPRGPALVTGVSGAEQRAQRRRAGRVKEERGR